jgi:hypothetical protein
MWGEAQGDLESPQASINVDLNLTLAQCPHGIRPPENKNWKFMAKKAEAEV